MASHLSSIGFPVQTEQDLYALAEKIAQKATPHEVDQGFYLSYQDPSGAAIWLHADKDRQIAGMNPHFVGPSIMTLKIVRSVHRDKDHAFDGAYFGWVAPEEEHDHQEGAYPLLFDAPDYRRYHQEKFPATLPVQIAAFAHELEVFASDEAWKQKNGDKSPIAAESFIPAGLFPADGRQESEAIPTAHALISGHVLDAQKRTNQMTGKSFWWLQVQSYAAIYDVVVDPLLLRSDPKPGCVVKGSFWLSGVVLDQAEHKPQNGFLRLLRSRKP
ncbi:MAG TPA: hypothetical protein VFO10_24890 [Oligoflexus sp.]|uniref:hypothetical protein n=1 Tax=Oligoflexus sp. TaxID=1971216 RepID=UPI002D7E6819|nr:hypothetical protein [Oligoflexus sp.]HET9240524.1 hypothetical protein [Oligoflexus sp.]